MHENQLVSRSASRGYQGRGVQNPGPGVVPRSGRTTYLIELGGNFEGKSTTSTFSISTMHAIVQARVGDRLAPFVNLTSVRWSFTAIFRDRASPRPHQRFRPGDPALDRGARM